MADVYSTRFAAWALLTGSVGYIVPNGHVAVLRDLDIWSGGGSIINWELAVSGVCKIAAGQFTIIAEAQTAQWRGRQVVPAGEQIYVLSDGPTDGALSGYLLSLP